MNRRWMWLLCVLAALAACRPADDAAPVQAPDAAALDEAELRLLHAMDGVWATTSGRSGGDDAEDVYRFRFRPDAIDFVHHDRLIFAKAIDIDTGHYAVTLQTTSDLGPGEVLTLSKMFDSADKAGPDAPFTLRLTWGQGSLPISASSAS